MYETLQLNVFIVLWNDRAVKLQSSRAPIVLELRNLRLGEVIYLFNTC